jgi:hypothetical protein
MRGAQNSGDHQLAAQAGRRVTVRRAGVAAAVVAVAAAVGACGGSAGSSHVSKAANTAPIAGTARHLTVAQLRQAQAAAAIISKECQDEYDMLNNSTSNSGEETALTQVQRETPAADQAESLLASFLQQDPDTRYQSTAGAVTMRQLASGVAANASAAGSGTCGDVAQQMQTALNGLPQ